MHPSLPPLPVACGTCAAPRAPSFATSPARPAPAGQRQQWRMTCWPCGSQAEEGRAGQGGIGRGGARQGREEQNRAQLHAMQEMHSHTPQDNLVPCLAAALQFTDRHLPAPTLPPHCRPAKRRGVGRQEPHLCGLRQPGRGSSGAGPMHLWALRAYGLDPGTGGCCRCWP